MHKDNKFIIDKMISLFILEIYCIILLLTLNLFFRAFLIK
jgi:hypothetical protein